MTVLRKRGQLIPFEPALPLGEAYRRRLWLHPNVEKWASTVGTDAREQRHFDDVRAFLTGYVIGDDFDDDVKMKELNRSQRGWYEMRVIFQPQHRIIGGFSRPGEFVALTHGRRDRLDKNFAPTIDRAVTIWSSLFPNMPQSKADRASLLEGFDE